MPPIGYVVGNVDFKDLALTIRSARLNPDGTVADPAIVVSYGKFIQTVIDFLIIAFCVFLLVKGINRLQRAGQGGAEAAPRRRPTVDRDPRPPEKPNCPDTGGHPMNDLIDLVARKAGISTDQAKAAVDAVAHYLGEKLPGRSPGGLRVCSSVRTARVGRSATPSNTCGRSWAAPDAERPCWSSAFRRCRAEHRLKAELQRRQLGVLTPAVARPAPLGYDA